MIKPLGWGSGGLVTERGEEGEDRSLKFCASRQQGDSDQHREKELAELDLNSKSALQLDPTESADLRDMRDDREAYLREIGDVQINCGGADSSCGSGSRDRQGMEYQSINVARADVSREADGSGRRALTRGIPGNSGSSATDSDIESRRSKGVMVWNSSSVYNYGCVESWPSSKLARRVLDKVTEGMSEKATSRVNAERIVREMDQGFRGKYEGMVNQVRELCRITISAVRRSKWGVPGSGEVLGRLLARAKQDAAVIDEEISRRARRGKGMDEVVVKMLGALRGQMDQVVRIAGGGGWGEVKVKG